MVAAPAMRAILDADEDFAGSEPLVLRSNAEALRRVAGGCVHSEAYLYEAAGRAFFWRLEAMASTSPEDEEEKDDTSDEGGDEEGERRHNRGKKGGAILKLSPLLKDVKLYELIGVHEGASQDELKKAYRALCLTCHPDKQEGITDEGETKRIQEHFVKIQEAYEILSDPEKRQLYDSSLEFDDSMPWFKPGGEADFYEVFDEAFKRNARFSIRKPVPELGGPESPMPVVKRFYDFWYGFQSWRDPLALAQAEGEDLCDLEDAECREEKRWMIRENNRVAKKYKQAEKDRVEKLVSMAERYDPRILAEKEAKKAARAADAARREEERMAVQRARDEEERKRKAAEEAEKAAEAEQRRQEKAAKDSAKAELKKCRQRVRALHTSVKEFVVLDQLNEVCLQLNQPNLTSLADDVEAALGEDGADAAVTLLYRVIEDLGMKPVPPKVEDDAVSTASGCPSEISNEDPAAAEERRRLNEERRLLEEERRRVAAEVRRVKEEEKAAEREAAAAATAEERRKREEQRKKDEAVAEAARKQLEKKEKLKAKKEEEKKKKAEEQEKTMRDQMREESKKKALEQAEKDRAAHQAEQDEKEVERIATLFNLDRLERLEQLDKLNDDDLACSLQGGCEADQSLCGALHLLRSEDIPDTQKIDCCMTLVNAVSPVWPLGLDPPADVKLTNVTRNKVKKARTRLRDAATKFLSSIAADFGADAVAQVTDYQRGLIDGKLAYKVWTAEAREQELRERAQKQAEAEAASTSPQKKGKKGKDAKAKACDDDIDALLVEFGDTSTGDKEKKSKKKAKK